jgi:hypothetical protein
MIPPDLYQLTENLGVDGGSNENLPDMLICGNLIPPPLIFGSVKEIPLTLLLIVFNALVTALFAVSSAPVPILGNDQLKLTLFLIVLNALVAVLFAVSSAVVVILGNVSFVPLTVDLIPLNAVVAADFAPLNAVVQADFKPLAAVVAADFAPLNAVLAVD